MSTAHTHDHQPPPKRQPTAGELLWTLTKDGATLRCELRDRGDLGAEPQLLRDGELVSGRLSPARALALAEAEGMRQHYGEKGWRQA